MLEFKGWLKDWKIFYLSKIYLSVLARIEMTQDFILFWLVAIKSLIKEWKNWAKVWKNSFLCKKSLLGSMGTTIR